MKNFLLTLAAMASLSSAAQINSPEAQGYLARGRLMYAQANYLGCIDQLSALDRDALSAAERENADWLLANAAYLTAGSSARSHFRTFLANYPASPLRELARVRMADCILESEPARALQEYLSIDAQALPADEADSYLYHTAYARILTGELAGALPAMVALAPSKTVGNDARYYAGYICYRHGQTAEARRWLSQVDRNTRPGAFAEFYLAQIAYADADYDSALRAARAAVQSTLLPESYRTEALRLQGESLFHLGKTREGIKALEQYLAKTDSPARSAQYLVGLEEYRCGHFDRALALLEPVASDSDSMGQTAYLYIGEILMDRGDTNAAILAFDNARRQNFDAKVREAAMYDFAVARTRGASVPFASSVEVFEEYLRQFPDGAHAPSVQEFIVKGYLTDKNYDAALASIERMNNPSAAVLAAKQQILYALGSRALAAGDLAAADSYLTRARQLSRHSAAVDAQAALALGETRYRQGRSSDAVTLISEYLRSAAPSDPNQAIARYDLGYARLALKDYADAAVNFSRVAEKPGQLSDATVADALARLADTYYYRSDWTTAARYYDEAYRRNPSAGDYPLFQKAVMQGYRRDHEGKIRSLGAMLDEFPTSTLRPDALMELTESYQQLGQTSKAIETYRRVASDFPETVQGRRACLQLALTLLNSGRRDEAAEAYRRVIALYPTSDEAAMAADEFKRIAADEGTLAEFAQFLATVDNGPRLDADEAERLEFEAAEKSWLTTKKTGRLAQYLAHYPAGASRPQALGYMAEAFAAEPARVLQYAAEIIEKYPHSAPAERALEASARAHASLGMGEEALADWQALATQASTSQTRNAARIGIMRTAREMANAELTLRSADELLASSTTGSEVRSEAIFSRGLAYNMMGDTDKARAAWKEIADDTDDLHGTKAAFYLAESYTREPCADLEAASRRLDSLIDSGTPHTYWLARAFILLSDVRASQGNTFEAREYLRSLRENYPGSEPDIIQMIDTRLQKLQ